MKYLQTKAHKVFKLIIEWELLRGLLRYTIANLSLPFWARQFALISLSSLPIKSSLTYAHHRCALSNRSRAIFSFTKLNRMRFKMMISGGHMAGIKKNAW